MRRGKKRIVGAVVLAVMVVVIAILLVRTVFVVRSVEITGNSAIASADVIRASGIRFGRPLSEVDEAEVEKGINLTGRLKFESLDRRYPNTVEICVSERKPAAMLLHAGNILVMDREGCVIEARNQVPNQDLVYISNLGVVSYHVGHTVSGDASRIAAYTAVMEAIEHHSASGTVSEVNFENIADIRIITRSGITVRLGNSENIRDKIAWMKAAAADLESRRETGGVLDVSSAKQADYTPAAIVRK